MAANETNVTYEQLMDIEQEFEDAELDIMRQQAVLTKPLYQKRAKAVADIPNFWPLVFEQAPPEVDSYIQPSDSAILTTALKSFSVSRFEVEDGGKGDPRSLAIKFEFVENEYFENSVLEKKLWYRQSKDGRFSGVVGEPVAIKWKSGKDLTGGLLDMAVSVFQQEQKSGQTNGTSKLKVKNFTPEQKALQKKIQSTGMGGISFFAFFGYRGYPVSEEENQAALKQVTEKRQLRAEGKGTEDDDDEAPELVDADEDEDEEEVLDIFPDGEELAVALAEDLWPSAIKYFTQAQEQDDMSEMDFEELEDEDEDEDDEQPPAKKHKS